MGIQFDVTAACKLTGLSFYDSFIDPATVQGDYAFGQVWVRGTGGNPIALGKFVANTAVALRWNFIWFHPQPVLVVGTNYLAAVLYVGGGFYRNTTFLPAGGTTRNHIHMASSFQSTALDMMNATITTNLNANAIDPLIKLV